LEGDFLDSLNRLWREELPQPIAPTGVSEAVEALVELLI